MGRLGKKDTDYFEYFCVSANCACRAAEYLHESLRDFDYTLLPGRIERMHEIEHEADTSKHEMTRLLSHEFITPIEREDVVALAQELDNVVDAIDEVFRRIYMFDVKEIRSEVHDFTALIIQCCRALEDAVVEMRSFKTSKTIHDKFVAVNSLESDGDILHSGSLHKLFAEGTDARTTLVWMTLFDGFEECFDACEDAVDIIEAIVMKNK